MRTASSMLENNASCGDLFSPKEHPKSSADCTMRLSSFLTPLALWKECRIEIQTDAVNISLDGFWGWRWQAGGQEEEFYGCGERGCEVSWCENRQCRGQSDMEADDWLPPPMEETTQREDEYRFIPQRITRAGYCLKFFNTGTNTFTLIPVPEQYFFDTNFI